MELLVTSAPADPHRDPRKRSCKRRIGPFTTAFHREKDVLLELELSTPPSLPDFEVGSSESAMMPRFSISESRFRFSDGLEIGLPPWVGMTESRFGSSISVSIKELGLGLGG